MKRKPVCKNKIASFIRTFCKEISNETPVLVPYVPIAGKVALKCFEIVPEHIAAYGGKQIFGWSIHVWKRVMVEAQFHCVWCDPSGGLADITPKAEQNRFTVFLPDANKKYTGCQVDNIRKALAPDPVIETFIGLYEKRFRLMNQGDLSYKHGKLGDIVTDERFFDVLGDLENLMIETQSQLVVRYGIRKPTKPY